MIFEIWVSEAIIFHQDLKRVTGTGGIVHHGNPVTLFQPFHAASGIRRFLPPSQVVFSQSASAKKTLSRSVLDGLYLGQRGNRVFDRSVVQAFFCWQTLTKNTFLLQQGLTLNQTVVAHRTKGTKSQLALSSTVQLVVRFSRTRNLQLVLKSSAVGYKYDDDLILQPIPLTSNPGEMTLTYQGFEISLRRPVFQNAERMHYSRISRRTSGNELDVYRDPIWPKFQRLAFDFEHLTEKQVKDAAYFFSHSVGKDISIVDHQGIGWVGFVTTPESEIIQGTRSGFNLSFEFEGVMT